jgi:ABC-type Na+ efflux pump permease subunit
MEMTNVKLAGGNENEEPLRPHSDGADSNYDLPAMSPAAPRRTIVLMAIVASTSTFSFGMMLYSVNTAMDSFKLFVNESLQVLFLIPKFVIYFDSQNHYQYTPSSTALEWFVAGLLCWNTVGMGVGMYATSILAEKYGRKSKLNKVYLCI